MSQESIEQAKTYPVYNIMPPFAATSNKPNRRQTAFEPAIASSPSTEPPADSSLVAASQPQVAVDSASINTIIALTVIFGVVFVAFALFVIYWLYMRRLIRIERGRALTEDVVWPGYRRYSRENHFRARTGGSLSASSAYSGSDGSGCSPKSNPPLRMPSSPGSSEEDVRYSRYVEGNRGYSAPGINRTRGYHPLFTAPRYPKSRKHQQTSPLFTLSFPPSAAESAIPHSSQSKPQRRRPSDRGKPRPSPGSRGTGLGSPVSKNRQQQSEDERAFSKRSHSRPSNAPSVSHPCPPPPEAETVDGTAGGT